MILHVFNSSVVSGPETLVLPNLAKLSVPVQVIFLAETRLSSGSEAPIQYAKRLGLETHEIEVESRLDLKAFRSLAECFERLSPSVIHAHDVKASFYSLIASILCERSRTKRWSLISTHHGVRGRSGFRSRAYEAFYSRIVLPKFDRVLTVCSSDRKLLLKRGLDKERVISHLNGVDRNEASTICYDQLRESWGIESNSTLIGVVGRLAPEKGLLRALKIFALLNSEHPALPKWNVVFLGEGRMRSKLEKQIKVLGLQNRVKLLGYRRDAAEEMVALDLLFSLSPAEGLPIALVEAGAAKIPVFSTAVDGINDLIPNPQYGFTVSPNDSDRTIASALAQAINHKTDRLTRAARFNLHTKEVFSGQRWRSELLSIYANLPANSTPPCFTKNLVGCIIRGEAGSQSRHSLP